MRAIPLLCCWAVALICLSSPNQAAAQNSVQSSSKPPGPGKDTTGNTGVGQKGQQYELGLSVQPPLLGVGVQTSVQSNTSPSASPNANNNAGDEMQRQDLKAQQSMANSAWAMFWAAIADGALSVVGIILVWKTFVVTKEVSDEQNRPWISLECQVMDGGFYRNQEQHRIEGYYLDIRAVAKNHGDAPATHVDFQAGVGLTGDPENNMQVFCDRIRRNNSGTEVIFPSVERVFNSKVFLRMQDIEERDRTRMPNILFIDLYGCISYKSTYIKNATGNVSQTRFRYILANMDSDNPEIIRAENLGGQRVDVRDNHTMTAD